jgi:hypothetical protein
MALFTDFTISTQFGTNTGSPGKFDSDTFKSQLQDSAIKVGIGAITRTGDTVRVNYKATTDAADDSAALAIVNNHTGQPTFQGPTYERHSGALLVTSTDQTTNQNTIHLPDYTKPETWIYTSEEVTSQTLIQDGVNTKKYWMPGTEGGATEWSASATVTAGQYLKNTGAFNGFVLRVQTGGDLGGTEPTWAPVEGDTVNDGTAVLVYEKAHVIVDVTNGKIPQEDTWPYDIEIEVDSSPVQETNIDNTGVYTTNHEEGSVTFDVDQGAAVITSPSYYRVKNADVNIVPGEGEVILIEGAKARSDKNVNMKDTVYYRLFGKIGQDPRLNVYWDQNPDGPAGPYPAGVEVEMGTRTYKTIRDMETHANKVHTISAHPSAGNRDVSYEVKEMEWDGDGAYNEPIRLKSSWGSRLAIHLQNNTKFTGGNEASGLLYGKKYKE